MAADVSSVTASLSDDGLMWAVRKTRNAAGFELVRCPIPTPAAGEVLLKVLACSLCGTDIHVHDFDPPFSHRVIPPITTGHEVCGEVLAFGHGAPPSASSSSSARPRPVLHSLVSVESHIPCRCLPSRAASPPCALCRRGSEHICSGVNFFSVDRDGFLAEYAVAPLYLCVLNPPAATLPWEIQALQESLGNSVYTVSTADVKGSAVAVFGLGPTGLNVIAVCKHRGAAKIIAVGGSEAHRSLAVRMGADLVIDRHTEDVTARIRQETGGDGVAVAFEMSGAASALHQALDCVMATGQVSILGLYGSDVIDVAVNRAIVLKDLTVRGVYGRRMWQTWDETAELLRTGLDVSAVITHRFDGLTDWAAGIAAMKSGACGKVCFFPHGRDGQHGERSA